MHNFKQAIVSVDEFCNVRSLLSSIAVSQLLEQRRNLSILISSFDLHSYCVASVLYETISYHVIVHDALALLYASCALSHPASNTLEQARRIRSVLFMVIMNIGLKHSLLL